MAFLHKRQKFILVSTFLDPPRLVKNYGFITDGCMTSTSNLILKHLNFLICKMETLLPLIRDCWDNCCISISKILSNIWNKAQYRLAIIIIIQNIWWRVHRPIRKIQTISVSTWLKYMTMQFTEDKNQIGNMHMNLLKPLQVERTLNFQFTALRLNLKIKSNNTKCWPTICWQR